MDCKIDCTLDFKNEQRVARFLRGINHFWNQPHFKFSEATDIILVIFVIGIFCHCCLLMFPFTTWLGLRNIYGNPVPIDHLFFEIMALLAHLLLSLTNCFRNLWAIPRIWIIQFWIYQLYMIYVLFGVILQCNHNNSNKPLDQQTNNCSKFRLAEHCIRFFMNIYFALVVRVYGIELYREQKFILRQYHHRAGKVTVKNALRRKQFVLPYKHTQRPKFGFGMKLKTLRLTDPLYLAEPPEPCRPDPEPFVFEEYGIC